MGLLNKFVSGGVGGVVDGLLDFHLFSFFFVFFRFLRFLRVLRFLRFLRFFRLALRKWSKERKESWKRRKPKLGKKRPNVG